MSALPTADDLHPADRHHVPVRPDGVLDLTHWVALHALLRAVARRVDLDPEGGLTFTLQRPYGWALATPARSVLFAGLRGVHARVTVPGIHEEPDTPSGRRRAAVRAWRAVR
jgi:hypothetical protein